MKNLKIIIFILSLLSLSVLAQVGPISPCVNCEQLSARTEPFNGMWYNPDQSGTGIGIDVQNGKLFGAYYGYDEQGKQIWLTFVGDLVPSDEPNIMWTLDTNLLQFENGNAFNQTYTAPNTTDYQGQIHLKFTQKNHALFSVNDGEQQNIVPIVFGVNETAYFPEQTSYKFPDLRGMWTFVYTFNRENVPESASIGSEVLYISSARLGDIDGDGLVDVRYSLAWLYGDNFFVGSIECKLTNNDTEIIGPECIFRNSLLSSDPLGPVPEYKMSVGGLGAFRLFGERDDGSTFEAIRINTNNYNE